MALSGFAIVGSKTTKGGSIVTGSEKTFCYGDEKFQIARIGDKHQCPDHGKVDIIGPVLPGQKRPIIEGKPVALIGDKTACGATITTGFEKILVFLG